MTDDRASSRRALLTGTGTALAGGALLLAGCGSVASGKKTATTAASQQLSGQDLEILQHALELERRTVNAYIACIPLLTRPQRKAFRQFLNEELQHTGEIASLITAGGGTPPPRADSYPIGHPTDGPSALAVIHSLEALQISSYLDWIPRLSQEPVRAAVASVLTVDAQHLTMCRVLQGQDPVPGPFVTGSA